LFVAGLLLTFASREYPKGEDEDDDSCNNNRRVDGKKKEQALKMRAKGWSSLIKNVRLDEWAQWD
jgi:hypothetical protein